MRINIKKLSENGFHVDEDGKGVIEILPEYPLTFDYSSMREQLFACGLTEAQIEAVLETVHREACDFNILNAIRRFV